MGYIGAARKHYEVLPVGPLIPDEPVEPARAAAHEAGRRSASSPGSTEPADRHSDEASD